MGSKPTPDEAAMQAANTLRTLSNFGHSVWLDYIDRRLLSTNQLKDLVEQDGVCGVTSNPAIFEKAITGSTDYRDILSTGDAGRTDAHALYERAALGDIRDAADVRRPLYERLNRRDGYVSLEVSPKLAYDTERTLDEARRLWRAVDRGNVMIKVPGAAQGVPAMQQLIAEGVNVNVTLLFSEAAYERVAGAFMAGLELLARNGGDVSRVASVASFFVSRIESAVDKLLSARIPACASEEERNLLCSIVGKVANANAKQTYQRCLRLFSGPRWDALAAQGARPQRILWASTGTKNPAYRDVVYVEELIGPDTVNTMPIATLDAFRDHGRPRASLTEHVSEADVIMESLGRVGISMADVTYRLLDDGIALFAEAFDGLLEALDRSSSIWSDHPAPS
jgi:transaldolase / glucose-6-phosphate isomerase